MSSASRQPTENAGPIIGTLNEKSLHAALKAWYAQPGDAQEVEVDGYVVDLVRDGLLIEVQTRGFTAIRDKLRDLVEGHRVLLVYPIAQTKWIVKVTPPRGEQPRERISRRRSPKRGRPLDVFDELVRMPRLLAHPNLALEIVLCGVDEIRCDDGEGSWRRKGVSILDQELVEVRETLRISGPGDLLTLLPPDLVGPFTNRALAQAAGIRVRLAQRITYTLQKMGLLERAGREGRAYLYRRCAPAEG